MANIQTKETDKFIDFPEPSGPMEHRAVGLPQLAWPMRCETSRPERIGGEPWMVAAAANAHGLVDAVKSPQTLG